jgi:hypothetical protein
MLVMQISKHSPENCPAFEAKYRAVAVNGLEKMESLAAKHKVKVVGGWTDHPGHTVYIVYDTPSMDNLMGFSMEPEMMAIMAFSTSETKLLITLKETLALIKK